ncbi:hypothetical protein [Streptomyces sp. NPDC006875]|uniref:hypothetical protein n=1 Tax=Streptomyces sp. NPDC006875 TaxID=3154781 RepID=UPI0033F18C4B
MSEASAEDGLISSRHMSGEPVRTCEPAILTDADPALREDNEGGTPNTAIILGED